LTCFSNESRPAIPAAELMPMLTPAGRRAIFGFASLRRMILADVHTRFEPRC
jgi:hypothetical protein